jgi:hypothetical protein
VIDLKELFKIAENLGNLLERALFAGKSRHPAGYQQSCPQVLGVSFVFYINHGLKPLFHIETCEWSDGAPIRTLGPGSAAIQRSGLRCGGVSEA